jgi:hypothetical protein
MKTIHALGFLIFAGGLADAGPNVSVRQEACSVELAMHEAPHGYLVAVFEHTAERKCNERDCDERVAVVEVLKAGNPSFERTSINVLFPAQKEYGGIYPAGTRYIGVYVPAASGTHYLNLSASYLASADLVAEYQEAIKLAESAPSGAPHCKDLPH